MPPPAGDIGVYQSMTRSGIGVCLRTGLGNHGIHQTEVGQIHRLPRLLLVRAWQTDPRYLTCRERTTLLTINEVQLSWLGAAKLVAGARFKAQLMDRALDRRLAVAVPLRRDLSVDLPGAAAAVGPAFDNREFVRFDAADPADARLLPDGWLGHAQLAIHHSAAHGKLGRGAAQRKLRFTDAVDRCQ